MDLRGKKVLIFGSGRSGIGAQHLLASIGAVPIIFDENREADVQAIREKLSGDAEIMLGEIPEERLAEIDLVVLSPGVPVDSPAVQRLAAHGLRLWSEIELAWQLGKGKVLAVTGTNGKTTTTALLGKILGDYYPEVYVVGNIGKSYADAVPHQTDAAWTAAEISSFQLETIEEFHPMGAVITNITEDHLNRHHTMEEYIRVKERIVENMDESDLCVLNYEDPVLREFGKSIRPKVMYFSSARALPEGIYFEDGVIRVAAGGEVTDLVRADEMQILGLHNVENVCCAAALAMHAGVPIDSIRASIRAFGGVEHRIEYVDEIRGVRYYNDSKGTNPDAAIRAVRAMDRPTLLIGGGYDKNATYGEWIDSFDGKVKYFALIGQTREKIAKEAVSCGFPQENIHFFENLEEAVNACAANAAEGDAVLLSPACASWGQFVDYEERGRKFKEYVKNLA